MNIEKRISPGLCRCCGGLTVHRTLTETYRQIHGEKEIYSDMIKYCFGIQFSGIDGTCKAQSKVICGPCVLKLRDAFAFKKQIEENEKKILRQNGIPKALNMLQASCQITPVENKPEPCRECELRKAEDELKDQSKWIKDTLDKNIQTDDLIIMCELELNNVKPVLGKPNILQRKPRKATLVPRIITIDECDNRAKSSELLTLPTSTASKITKRSPASQRKPRKSDKLDIANKIPVDEYQSDANNLELNPPIAISERTLQVENETPNIEGIFIVKKEILQTEMDTGAVDVLKQEHDITNEEIMPPEERVEIKEELEEEMIVETLDADSEDDGNDIDDENDIENDENVVYDDDYEDDTPAANAELIINNCYAVPFRKTISRVRCYYCDKYIPDHNLLREHILEHSPDEFKHSGDKFIRIDVKRIDCRQCGRKIEDLASLGRHLYKTHGERYMCIARSGVIPYVLDNSSQCVVCGDKYTSFLDLDDHMQKHFTDHVCECDNVYMDETSLQAHLSAINSSSNACQICHKYYMDAATLSAHDRRTHEEAQISDWSAENVSCSNDDVSDPPESDEEFYRKRKKPKKKTYKPISQTHFSDLEDDAGLEDLWDEHFKQADQINGNFEEISGENSEKFHGETLIKSNNSNENLSKKCGENVAEINGHNLDKIKSRNFGETSGKHLYENSSYPEKQPNCLPRRQSNTTEIRKSGRPRKEIDYSHKPRKAEYVMIKKSRKSRYTKRKSTKKITQKSNCDNVIVIE